MRRIALGLFTLFVLSFGMTTSVAAQDVDCPDLTYEEAQAILAQDPSDPNRLDADNDGEACENNARSGAAAPAGGAATGGTTQVPAVGSGTALYNSDGSNVMLAALFGGAATVLGLAALRLRHQS